MAKKLTYWRKGEDILASNCFEPSEAPPEEQGYRQVELDDMDDDMMIQFGDGAYVAAGDVSSSPEGSTEEDDDDDPEDQP